MGMHSSGSAEVGAPGGANHQFAFGVMTSLFFIWGFITALNDILIPHLKAAFDLSYTQAMLVQFCFFGAYFLVSPFAGKLLELMGYKRGIIIGLLTIATGCGLFYPAAELEAYPAFLAGLFILAAGVAMLQVSANPYVSILGPERTAASRLILAQAINSLGHTLAPMFGAILILAVTAESGTASAKAVQLPYLLLAGVMVSTAIVFFFLKLPVVSHVEQSTAESARDSIWNHKPLVLGALGIFLYVGAEVTIGSFLVNYFAQPDIAGMAEAEAGHMVSYYWGAAMVGRFVGAVITRRIAPFYVLGFNALLSICLILVSVMSSGHIAMWSILAVGFFNSIMFPTIFSLAIRGLGSLTGRGSGLLCQAIVGGAILPVIQGAVADLIGVQLSFIVPALCYVYIGWYAIWGQDGKTVTAFKMGASGA